MYSSLQLAQKFSKYFLTASNGKGHGIHSPFVFNFVKSVLNDEQQYESYGNIEQLRKHLIQDQHVLTIEDFGAGSTVFKSNKRKVADIAKSALKPKKFGQLLFRMVQYYKPATIMELGTSLGVTSSYIASGDKSATLYTFEGASQVAEVAKKNFEQLSLNNIHLIHGNFDETLLEQLNKLPVVDFAFVDGNHRKQPTLNYFYQLLEKANENSILIFDDIHWSKEMEDAWKEIQAHTSVTLTIDLFFIGIVFFRKEQKVQQHFTIRF
ncbi:MAG TPA: class I SAM-dependent methyltransferase [Segetibacter sp.]|jgi:predicted O-methyltransferase YrrM